MDNIIKQTQFAGSNHVLINQAFSELFSFYLSKKDATERDFKQLWDFCVDNNFAVSSAAFGTVTRLMNQNILSVGNCMNVILSLAATTRHIGPLVQAVGEALATHIINNGQEIYVCPFKVDYPQHPFITVVNLCPESWPWVLEAVKHLTLHNNTIVKHNSLIALKPLILHAICSKNDVAHYSEFRLSLWSHLLWTLRNNIHGSEDLVLSALSLMQDKKNFIFKIHCLQTTAEFCLGKPGFRKLSSTVVLLLTSVVSELLSEGTNVYHTLLLVERLVETFDLAVEPFVVLLSECLLECPAAQLGPILFLCDKWKERVSNPIVWTILQSASLQIAGFQTSPSPSIALMLRNILHSENMKHNKTLSLDFNDKHLNVRSRLAVSATRIAENLVSGKINIDDWLQKISKTLIGSQSPAVCLLVAATFLKNREFQTVKTSLALLLATVREEKKLSLFVLALLLRKLSTTDDGLMKTEVLYALPQLAVDKVCLPKVLQIINALDSVLSLQPMKIKLLTELWLFEDRTYFYLEKSLHGTSKDFELQLAKAFALFTICTKRPEKYGADWLSAISQQLSAALGAADESSCALAVISLRTIAALCEAEVVDLRSVWVMLAPKLLRDHRSPVRKEMCKLLGLTPQLRVDSPEYDCFVKDVIRLLFDVSLNVRDKDTDDVILESFSSLAKFRRSDFSLDVIPDVCKASLKGKPEGSASTNDEPLLTESVNSVPSECWSKLLDVDPYGQGIESLLLALVKEEVKEMPNWVYRKTASEHIRRMEPPSYNYLKEDSVLRVLIGYLVSGPPVKRNIQIIMRILSQKFEKSLPPLDWSVFWQMAQAYDCELEMLKITSQLCPTSFSAKNIIEKYLETVNLKAELNLTLVENLPPISAALGSASIQKYLDLKSRDLITIPGFFRSLRLSLETKTFAEETGQAVVRLLHEAPRLNGDSDFANCVLQLPLQVRNSLWKIESCGFFENFLNSAARVGQCGDILDLILECVETIASDERLIPGLYDLLTNYCNWDMSAAWFVKFLGKIREILAKKQKEESLVVQTLLNVFVLALCVLSGTSAVYGDGDLIASTSWDSFAISVANILQKSSWNAAHVEIASWLLLILENYGQRLSTELKATIQDGLKVLKNEGKIEDIRHWSLIVSSV